MENNAKLLIYKGIIQYLLSSTGYTLKNIADLSGAHVSSIRMIYCDDCLPQTFTSEMQLISLYQFVVESSMQSKKWANAR